MFILLFFYFFLENEDFFLYISLLLLFVSGSLSRVFSCFVREGGKEKGRCVCSYLLCVALFFFIILSVFFSLRRAKVGCHHTKKTNNNTVNFSPASLPSPPCRHLPSFLVLLNLLRCLSITTKASKRLFSLLFFFASRHRYQQRYLHWFSAAKESAGSETKASLLCRIRRGWCRKTAVRVAKEVVCVWGGGVEGSGRGGVWRGEWGGLLGGGGRAKGVLLLCVQRSKIVKRGFFLPIMCAFLAANEGAGGGEGGGGGTFV